MSDITVKDFLDKFDSFKKTNDSNVIIHTKYDFSVWDEEFIKELKQEMKRKFAMYSAGVEQPDKTTTFVYSFLKDAF